MIRHWILLLACLLGALPARAAVLSIYGWPNYIDPAALDTFTAETGIEVHYTTYDSLAMLETTLNSGNSGYDVVMPSMEPTFFRLLRSKRLAVIDRAQVPNWKNLDAALMQRVEASDPGNLHGVIYLWGTLGLGMLPSRVKTLAPDAPLDSLALYFDPANAGRLASCNITMLDSPVAVVPLVLRYLGRSPDSTAAADLAEVERTLMRVRPFIHTFAKTSALQALTSEATCLALAFSGNVLQAAHQAAASKTGVSVQYAMPKEGALAEFDMLAIPADAPNKAAAHAFINFVLRPEVMAGITNVTRYPNAVPASRPMIDSVLLQDNNVFPGEEQMKSFFTAPPLSRNATMERNRLWARFKEAR